MGSIVNFTRPLVAFSTSVAQPCSTLAVRWCCGDTHDDIVSVVLCAGAGGTAARPASSAAITSADTFDMLSSRWGTAGPPVV